MEISSEHDDLCPNYTDSNGQLPPIKMLDSTERITAITVYSLIIILSLGGNSIVLFSIMHFNRLRRAPTNIFIANLAVADILMATFSVPFGYWDTLVMQYWPFGSLLCPTIYFIQCLAVMLSSHTLILICVDRFCAIMLTFSYKLRQNTALKALMFVWAVDITISFPIAVVQRITPMNSSNSSNYACSETWGSELAYLYSQAGLVMQYFLPIIVFLTTYTGIGVKLWYAQLPSSDSQYQTKTTKQRRDNTMKKLIIMMLMLCLVYTLCWLPLNMLNIAVTRCPSYTSYPYILYVWWGCHLVAMSHTFVNPIVYALTNARFREAYKFVLHKCCLPFGINVPYNAETLMDDAMVKYVFSNIHTHAGEKEDGNSSQYVFNNQDGNHLSTPFGGARTSKDPLLRLKNSPSFQGNTKSYETFLVRRGSSSSHINGRQSVVTFKCDKEASKPNFI